MSGECTGIAASWCPNCGPCSCARSEGGERVEPSDACLLHGDSTRHAATLCAGGCGEVVAEHGERCLRCEVKRLTQELADAREALREYAPRCRLSDCDELARLATHQRTTGMQVEYACDAHVTDDPDWCEDDHAAALRAARREDAG